jgi:hypothetical protein
MLTNWIWASSGSLSSHLSLSSSLVNQQDLQSLVECTCTKGLAAARTPLKGILVLPTSRLIWCIHRCKPADMESSKFRRGMMIHLQASKMGTQLLVTWICDHVLHISVNSFLQDYASLYQKKFQPVRITYKIQERGGWRIFYVLEVGPSDLSKAEQVVAKYMRK